MIEILTAILWATSGSFAFAKDDATPVAPLTYEAYIEADCNSLLDPKALALVLRAHRHLHVSQMPKYELGIPRTERIHDQCEVGSCWAEAVTSLWEVRAQKAFGQAVHLSPDYILRNHLIDAARKGGHYFNESLIRFGSELRSGLKTLSSGGVLPSGEFVPKFRFRDHAGISNRMEIDLSFLTMHYRNHADLKEKALLKYLGMYFPEPPEQFSFIGHLWTPHSLARIILQESGAPTDLVEIDAHELGLEKFEKLVVAHLKQFEEPVVMTMEWDTTFFDDLHAVMSVGGFATYLGPNYNSTMSSTWSIARSLRPLHSRHALLAWDYAIDEETKEFYSFLMLNSWGKRWGDGGYVHVFQGYLMHAKPKAWISRSILEKSK